MEVEISLCCNDIRWYNTTLCRNCKEHADFISYDTDEFENNNKENISNDGNN